MKADTAMNLEKKREQEDMAEQALVTAHERSIADGHLSNFKLSDIKMLNSKIFIHPTTLLSIIDHYSRSVKDTNRRVVGCLLGEQMEDGLHITNCYGVPFEEMNRSNTLWHLDTTYLLTMFKMFKKINAKEKMVGWYSTASSIRPNDSEIHELFREHTPHPVYLLLDVVNENMPVQTYLAFELLRDSSKSAFVHIGYQIASQEAEEVAVEHLLKHARRNYQHYSLTTKVPELRNALKTAKEKISVLVHYLQQLMAKPEGLDSANNILIADKLQKLFNSFPNVTNHQILESAMNEETNKELAITYVSHANLLIASLHKLIENKEVMKS